MPRVKIQCNSRVNSACKSTDQVTDALIMVIWQRRPDDDARADTFDYIERFYDPRRRHSSLGGISPMEYEKRAKLA
jgi:transposase InsO family protein